jgi:hypothetical protein
VPAFTWTESGAAMMLFSGAENAGVIAPLR